MPKGNDWFNFIYVTVAYVALATGMILFVALEDIRANWPKYRCNPVYMPLSKNVSADFTYCIQNMQSNYMGVLLKPITWIIKNLGSMAEEVFGSLQMFRKMIYYIRSMIMKIITSIMGIFANFTIQMQKLAIAVKDTVGKLMGVLVSLVYMLDGSVKTMQSAWAGPPGQMVRFMCFREDTLVPMSGGNKMKMNDISLGDTLYNGKKVLAVLKVSNANDEPFYKFSGKNGNSDIYVTGSHYVLDETSGNYIMTKNHPAAVLTTEKDSSFACLITEDHTIPLGDYVFWDWEDDIIPNKA
jgi:hypothetical protein